MNSRNDHPILKILGAFLFALVVSFATDFFAALVLRSGWNWFVVPATGFQPLSYWLAFGILCVCSFIYSCVSWNKSNDNQTEDDTSDFPRFAARILGKGIGAIIGMALSLGIMALIALGV